MKYLGKNLDVQDMQDTVGEFSRDFSRHKTL